MTQFVGLPDWDLIVQGLDDLASGRETAASLLVAAASARLSRLGVDVPEHEGTDAELRLYGILCQERPSSAYREYTSLLRRVASFARALEREQGATIRAARQE